MDSEAGQRRTKSHRYTQPNYIRAPTSPLVACYARAGPVRARLRQRPASGPPTPGCPLVGASGARTRKAIDKPSRTIPAPAPRRRSLRRRYAKRQRSRPGWPAWPLRPDKAWGARQANRSFSTPAPARPRGPFPPMTPARIECVPPCAPSRKLACPRQAKALASRTPRKVRLRAQQSPPRPATWTVHRSRARQASKSDARIRAPDQRVTWGTHRFFDVVEGGPGSRLRREQSPYAALRAARCGPAHRPGQGTPAVEPMLP